MKKDNLAQAKEAREKAYAPYSKFKVGAALVAKNGEVFEGCNVENATYGLAICAERVALSTAVARGVQDFDSLTIVADTSKPVVPCGQCLQVLAEFVSPDFPISLANVKGDEEQVTLGDLLPRQFKLL